ncbi:MAG: hypothetical protein CVU03_11100 [Bacteroidetes bacterium HGW-Bacteroidetes-2]|jgi:hypothetical protein|nr:MAG: hypothetical protein CVU03_11100 [Bacteroidetes bacterium HGW-Bacteroidetes-2]
MKKIILAIALIFTASIALVSCRETKTTEIIKEVEVKTEDSKGALERAAEKVDSEVNKEIDKQIDKIGDDN